MAEMASISASQRGRATVVSAFRGWVGLLSRWPRSGTSSSNLQETFWGEVRVELEIWGEWVAYFCLREDGVDVVVGHGCRVAERRTLCLSWELWLRRVLVSVGNTAGDLAVNCATGKHRSAKASATPATIPRGELACPQHLPSEAAGAQALSAAWPAHG